MTMILAHVLPDRKSGFIMADRRWSNVVQRSYADCGGKVLATPLGWAAATGRGGRGINAAYDALRAARSMELNQMLMAPESRRFLLEHIIGLELIKDRLPLAPDATDDLASDGLSQARHATTVALEVTEAGVSLFVVNAARASIETDYGNVPPEIGESFLSAMDAAEPALEPRIIAAAQAFARSRWGFKSDDVSVGTSVLRATDTGAPALHKRFLEGDAAAIAATAPEILFDAFRAEPPTLTGGEMITLGLATMQALTQG